jgi:hypothetical protein
VLVIGADERACGTICAILENHQQMLAAELRRRGNGAAAASGGGQLRPQSQSGVRVGGAAASERYLRRQFRSTPSGFSFPSPPTPPQRQRERGADEVGDWAAVPRGLHPLRPNNVARVAAQ